MTLASPNVTLTLNATLNFLWVGREYIAQCHSDLDSNLEFFGNYLPQGSKVRRKRRHGGSLLPLVGAEVHRKSPVCNFCSPPTDCISTAVAETAVLKILCDQGVLFCAEQGISGCKHPNKCHQLRNKFIDLELILDLFISRIY